MMQALAFPIPLVCPSCRAAALQSDGITIRCAACESEFRITEGFVDLILGERFTDDSDETCQCYEEVSNAHTVEHYWIPLFKRLFADLGRRPRILAVGCGTGVEVDKLHEAGFDAVGIEIGDRTRSWPRRQARDWLMLANGMHMPFADDSFDAVFCGCVFPHLGVVGDSFVVTERYREDRLAMAREMVRVARPGGHIVTSSPNRHFPFDIFHGREPGSYRPRVNWPGSHFLLSVSDYRTMLRDAGCDRVAAEPADGYWGFVRSKHSLKGLLLGAPVRLLFWLTSLEPMRFLRGSVLAPWLVVHATKPGA